MAESKLKFVNMKIKTFHFNPLMVNTYILSDETNEAVIVDPGNCRSYEDAQIRDYVSSNGLKSSTSSIRTPILTTSRGTRGARPNTGLTSCCTRPG